MLGSSRAAAWLGCLPVLLVCACEQKATPAPPVAAQSPPSPKTPSTVGAAERVQHVDPKDLAEPDFARVDGPRGLRTRTNGAFEGYTLISPLNSRLVRLIDMEGKAVHTWNTSHVPGGSVYFLPNGHLLRTAMVEKNPRFHAGGIGGRIEELDWDGKTLWEFELANAQRTLHHDISLLPNGNVLAIAWEYHSPEEAFELGRAPAQIDEEGLWCEVVIEIHPVRPAGGEIVWEWRSVDHLVQDTRERSPNFGSPKDFPGRIDINADHRYDAIETDLERRGREERQHQMQGLGYTGGKPGDKAQDRAGDKPPPRYPADWMHFNAVEYLPEQDLIALSTSRLCELWVIDHSTTTAQAASSSGGRRGHGGELLYRYGHSRNYGIGDESSRRLFRQHNVSWLPGPKPGTYSFLVFNNGDRRPGVEYSSVEEFPLPFDAERGFERKPGEAFGPEKISWTYNDPTRFFSPFVSGAQRLPNGNTLICEGSRGRVFEVTRSGEIVWDFYSPFAGEIKPAEQSGKSPAHALFRATRIAKDHPALADKR